MSLKPLCQDCCRKTSQNSLKALLWRRHRETSLMSLEPLLRRFCGMRRSAHSLQLLLATGQNPFPQYVRAFLTTNSIWRKSIHNLVSANHQRMQLMLTLRIDHKALLSSPCNILMHCKPKQCNADAHTHSEETIKLFSLYSLCNAPCSEFQW